MADKKLHHFMIALVFGKVGPRPKLGRNKNHAKAERPGSWKIGKRAIEDAWTEEPMWFDIFLLICNLKEP